eukprot:8528537-Pyramimonas_sp.AAC.2
MTNEVSLREGGRKGGRVKGGSGRLVLLQYSLRSHIQSDSQNQLWVDRINRLLFVNWLWELDCLCERREYRSKVGPPVPITVTARMHSTPQAVI